MDDVGDVPAKGAQGLLNGLLVTYIGKDLSKAGELGSALGRDVQAALGHQRQQADGLVRDRFAASIRARDDDRNGAGLWIEIDRYNGCWIEEGMAGVEHPERRCQSKLRLAPLERCPLRGILHLMQSRLPGPEFL